MSRSDDIRTLIQQIADAGSDGDKLALGDTSKTIQTGGDKRGQLWLADPSFMQILADALGEYFDRFKEEIDEELETIRDLIP